MKMLNKLHKLRIECRAVNAAVIPVLIRYALFKCRGKNLLTSGGVTIYGVGNITTAGLVKVGLRYVGFTNRHDRTMLRVNGKLTFKGEFTIAKGCRFDIGEHATVEFAEGNINPNTMLIIMHGMTMGAGCSVSWGCQFLDEDFHTLTYPGKSADRAKRIVIGSHVWIGSNVTVLKGSEIPDGCVVASGSVVSGRFTEENVLIAGNPAKIVKRNVAWG